MAVVLTDKAAGEIKRVMSEQQDALPPNPMLRIGISAGGCSGFSYSLGFDDAGSVDASKDQVSDQHGIKVAVDKASDLYLDGTVVDYIDEINRRGFAFTNPNAQKTCGCGSSFQA